MKRETQKDLTATHKLLSTTIYVQTDLLPVKSSSRYSTWVRDRKKLSADANGYRKKTRKF